jgi:ribosomal protein S18 acetylase RimI-like enzyme
MTDDLSIEQIYSEPFEVRPANLKDSDAIQALMSQLGYPLSEEVSRKQTTACLNESNGLLLVAEYRRAVLGAIYGVIAPSIERRGYFGIIWALVVDEAWRGRGLGEQLCAAAEEEFARRNVEVVYLTSGFPRTRAHEFYRKIGYRETGLRFALELPSLQSK